MKKILGALYAFSFIYLSVAFIITLFNSQAHSYSDVFVLGNIIYLIESTIYILVPLSVIILIAGSGQNTSGISSRVVVKDESSRIKFLKLSRIISWVSGASMLIPILLPVILCEFNNPSVEYCEFGYAMMLLPIFLVAIPVLLISVFLSINLKK